ncbi:hypothetical protein H1C71_036087, partial [Ictidomys tridecemlineatus]
GRGFFRKAGSRRSPGFSRSRRAFRDRPAGSWDVSSQSLRGRRAAKMDAAGKGRVSRPRAGQVSAEQSCASQPFKRRNWPPVTPPKTAFLRHRTAERPSRRRGDSPRLDQVG